jgi:hypothetical protein
VPAGAITCRDLDGRSTDAREQPLEIRRKPGCQLKMWVPQKSQRDQNGKRWHFCIWYSLSDVNRASRTIRVFFWDDKKEDCGVVIILSAGGTHFSRFKLLIKKLLADPALRKKHRRELRFPLERHYSDYGAFPEEK